MKYELVGKDLPELYEHQQDSIFHEGESWELARGEGWQARIETCGELNLLKDGEPIATDEVIAEYDTDEKLYEAFENGVLDFRNNNWYEVCFFADTEHGLFYIDDLTDFVCGDFEECIKEFDECIKDKDFCEELEKSIKEIKEELK